MWWYDLGRSDVEEKRSMSGHDWDKRPQGRITELRSEDESELKSDRNKTEKSPASRRQLPEQDQGSEARTLGYRKKTQVAKDEG